MKGLILKYISKYYKIEKICIDFHPQDLPKLNQEERHYFNRSIMGNNVKVVIISQPRRAQERMDSLLNSTKDLKRISTSDLHTVP